MLVLGIETSCDETAAAIYDTDAQRIRSSVLFSQTDIHRRFGGVVPELASRSHLEKIEPILISACADADVALSDIGLIAVTARPGLIGSLLVGVSYAKGIAWAFDKPLLGIDHLEGHVFSSFLAEDGSLCEVPFPHLALLASGGHTALYVVKGFGEMFLVGHTVDDAAGEAFDKIAVMLGLSYPGGPAMEQLAQTVDFKDYYHYPRSKCSNRFNMSFSGLKTAVMYDLMRRQLFDPSQGAPTHNLTQIIAAEVASSLHVCMADIFEERILGALAEYASIRAVTFVGGVAANQYLSGKLEAVAGRHAISFVRVPRRFCTDNAAMIALVGAYRFMRGERSDFSLDVLPTTRVSLR